MTLPLIRPDVGFDEVADDLRSILDSGVLTSGPYVARFEQSLAEIVGVDHVLTTTSATTALHLSLAAIDVGPGDEVLVSDFTFPASGNVVIQLGATPVLIDSTADSFAADPALIEASITDRTRAVMPVDPFGQPADLRAITEYCATRGIAVVEDAACALGAFVDDRACGSWGDTGCFSFHPRKVVTTGEGGAVTTNDASLADRMRRLRNHGGVRTGVGFDFVEAGFNYRLGEIPAALGLAQLSRLDAILDDRRRTAERYNELLGDVDEIEVRLPGAGQRWSYQSYVIVLTDSVDRDAVVRRMAERGIETTLGTYAMHAHPAFERFGYRPGDLPNAWRAQQQSLTLPLVPSMAGTDVERVVEELTAVVSESPRRG